MSDVVGANDVIISLDLEAGSTVRELNEIEASLSRLAKTGQVVEQYSGKVMRPPSSIGLPLNARALQFSTLGAAREEKKANLTKSQLAAEARTYRENNVQLASVLKDYVHQTISEISKSLGEVKEGAKGQEESQAAAIGKIDAAIDKLQAYVRQGAAESAKAMRKELATIMSELRKELLAGVVAKKTVTVTGVGSATEKDATPAQKHDPKEIEAQRLAAAKRQAAEAEVYRARQAGGYGQPINIAAIDDISRDVSRQLDVQTKIHDTLLEMRSSLVTMNNSFKYANRVLGQTTAGRAVAREDKVAEFHAKAEAKRVLAQQRQRAREEYQGGFKYGPNGEKIYNNVSSYGQRPIAMLPTRAGMTALDVINEENPGWTEYIKAEEKYKNDLSNYRQNFRRNARNAYVATGVSWKNGGRLVLGGRAYTGKKQIREALKTYLPAAPEKPVPYFDDPDLYAVSSASASGGMTTIVRAAKARQGAGWDNLGPVDKTSPTGASVPGYQPLDRLMPSLADYLRKNKGFIKPKDMRRLKRSWNKDFLRHMRDLAQKGIRSGIDPDLIGFETVAKALAESGGTAGLYGSIEGVSKKDRIERMLGIRRDIANAIERAKELSGQGINPFQGRSPIRRSDRSVQEIKDAIETLGYLAQSTTGKEYTPAEKGALARILGSSKGDELYGRIINPSGAWEEYAPTTVGLGADLAKGELANARLASDALRSAEHYSRTMTGRKIWKSRGKQRSNKFTPEEIAKSIDVEAQLAQEWNDFLAGNFNPQTSKPNLSPEELYGATGAYGLSRPAYKDEAKLAREWGAGRVSSRAPEVTGEENFLLSTSGLGTPEDAVLAAEGIKIFEQANREHSFGRYIRRLTRGARGIDATLAKKILRDTRGLPGIYAKDLFEGLRSKFDPLTGTVFGMYSGAISPAKLKKMNFSGYGKIRGGDRILGELLGDPNLSEGARGLYGQISKTVDFGTDWSAMDRFVSMSRDPEEISRHMLKVLGNVREKAEKLRAGMPKKYSKDQLYDTQFLLAEAAKPGASQKLKKYASLMQNLEAYQITAYQKAMRHVGGLRFDNIASYFTGKSTTAQRGMMIRSFYESGLPEADKLVTSLYGVGMLGPRAVKNLAPYLGKHQQRFLDRVEASRLFGGINPGMGVTQFQADVLAMRALDQDDLVWKAFETYYPKELPSHRPELPRRFMPFSHKNLKRKTALGILAKSGYGDASPDRIITAIAAGEMGYGHLLDAKMMSDQPSTYDQKFTSKYSRYWKKASRLFDQFVNQFGRDPNALEEAVIADQVATAQRAVQQRLEEENRIRMAKDHEDAIREDKYRSLRYRKPQTQLQRKYAAIKNKYVERRRAAIIADDRAALRAAGALSDTELYPELSGLVAEHERGTLQTAPGMEALRSRASGIATRYADMRLMTGKGGIRSSLLSGAEDFAYRRGGPKEVGDLVDKLVQLRAGSSRDQRLILNRALSGLGMRIRKNKNGEAILRPADSGKFLDSIALLRSYIGTAGQALSGPRALLRELEEPDNIYKYDVVRSLLGKSAEHVVDSKRVVEARRRSNREMAKATDELRQAEIESASDTSALLAEQEKTAQLVAPPPAQALATPAPVVSEAPEAGKKQRSPAQIAATQRMLEGRAKKLAASSAAATTEEKLARVRAVYRALGFRGVFGISPAVLKKAGLPDDVVKRIVDKGKLLGGTFSPETPNRTYISKFIKPEAQAETMAHELGHGLAAAGAPSDAVLKALAKESSGILSLPGMGTGTATRAQILDAIKRKDMGFIRNSMLATFQNEKSVPKRITQKSQKGKGQYFRSPEELYAEFIRGLIYHPEELQKLAPESLKKFLEFAKTSGADIYKQLLKVLDIANESASNNAEKEGKRRKKKAEETIKGKGRGKKKDIVTIERTAGKDRKPKGKDGENLTPEEQAERARKEERKLQAAAIREERKAWAESQKNLYEKYKAYDDPNSPKGRQARAQWRSTRRTVFGYPSPAGGGSGASVPPAGAAIAPRSSWYPWMAELAETDQTVLGKAARWKGSSFIGAMGRVGLYGGAMGMVYGGVSKLRESINEAKELENILIGIKKVAPADLDLSAVSGGMWDIAKKYGQDIKSTMELGRTFAQQGMDQVQILKMTENALLAVNAAELDNQSAVEFLTSAYNTWNTTAENSVQFIDKIMAVQGKYAVTAKELADAAMLLSPIFKQLGGSFDQMLGMVTAAKEVTRMSGSRITTAIRQMVLRYTQPDATKQLAAMGIQTRTEAGIVDPDTLIKQILSKSFNPTQMFDIAKTLGGRHLSVALALLQNYQTAIEATGVSLNSFGEAERANKEQMKSAASQWQAATTSIKEFGVQVSNATALPGIKFSAKILGGVGSALSSNPFISDVLSSAVVPGLLMMGGKALGRRANISSAGRAMDWLHTAAPKGMTREMLMENLMASGYSAGDAALSVTQMWRSAAQSGGLQTVSGTERLRVPGMTKEFLKSFGPKEMIRRASMSGPAAAQYEKEWHKAYRNMQANLLANWTGTEEDNVRSRRDLFLFTQRMENLAFSPTYSTAGGARRTGRRFVAALRASSATQRPDVAGEFGNIPKMDRMMVRMAGVVGTIKATFASMAIPVAITAALGLLIKAASMAKEYLYRNAIDFRSKVDEKSGSSQAMRGLLSMFAKESADATLPDLWARHGGDVQKIFQEIGEGKIKDMEGFRKRLNEVSGFTGRELFDLDGARNAWETFRAFLTQEVMVQYNQVMDKIGERRPDLLKSLKSGIIAGQGVKQASMFGVLGTINQTAPSFWMEKGKRTFIVEGMQRGIIQKLYGKGGFVEGTESTVSEKTLNDYLERLKAFNERFNAASKETINLNPIQRAEAISQDQLGSALYTAFAGELEKGLGPEKAAEAQPILDSVKMFTGGKGGPVANTLQDNLAKETERAGNIVLASLADIMTVKKVSPELRKAIEGVKTNLSTATMAIYNGGMQLAEALQKISGKLIETPINLAAELLKLNLQSKFAGVMGDLEGNRAAYGSLGKQMLLADPEQRIAMAAQVFKDDALSEFIKSKLNPEKIKNFYALRRGVSKQMVAGGVLAASDYQALDAAADLKEERGEVSSEDITKLLADMEKNKQVIRLEGDLYEKYKGFVSSIEEIGMMLYQWGNAAVIATQKELIGLNASYGITKVGARAKWDAGKLNENTFSGRLLGLGIRVNEIKDRREIEWEKLRAEKEADLGRTLTAADEASFSNLRRLHDLETNRLTVEEQLNFAITEQASAFQELRAATEGVRSAIVGTMKNPQNIFDTFFGGRQEMNNINAEISSLRNEHTPEARTRIKQLEIEKRRVKQSRPKFYLDFLRQIGDEASGNMWDEAVKGAGGKATEFLGRVVLGPKAKQIDARMSFSEKMYKESMAAINNGTGGIQEKLAALQADSNIMMAGIAADVSGIAKKMGVEGAGESPEERIKKLMEKERKLNPGDINPDTGAQYTGAEIKAHNSKVEAETEKSRKVAAWGAAGQVVGSLVAGKISAANNKSGAYAGLGSQLGSMAGVALANPYAAAFLPILGAITGAFLSPDLEPIEQNTKAIVNNTAAIEKLTAQVFHAPSTFTVGRTSGDLPAYSASMERIPERSGIMPV